MTRTIDQLFERQAEAFFAGDIDDIVENFNFPLPIYVADEVFVYDRDSLASAMAQYREVIRAEGIDGLKARVVAQGLPIRGRSTVWVEWDHVSANGSRIRTNQAQYMLAQAEGIRAPKIDMVDYRQVSFPEMVQAIAC